MRHGVRRVALLLGVLAAGVPLQAVALPQPPALVVAPSLPPQPGVAARSCLAQPPPREWALITRQRAAASVPLDSSPLFPEPGYQIAVDPQLSCRIYRAPDAGTVERSVDGGTTWTTVFHDTATGAYAGADPTCGLPQSSCALSSPPFTASSLQVLSQGVPGLLALGERGNGDAAVVSTDSGTTWSLADGVGSVGGVAQGLAGRRVQQLLVGRDGDPSDAIFGWAIAASDPGPGLPSAVDTDTVYITTDSGTTWLPTIWPPSGAPPATVDALAVDPAIPFLAFCVAGGTLYGGWSSSTSSGGPTQPMTWTILGAVPDARAAQLVLGPTTRAGLRMFLVGTGGDLHYADVVPPPQPAAAPGTTTAAVWHAVSLPASVRVSAVAVSAFGSQTLVAGTDASQPSRHRVRLFYSRDGLAPVQEISAPPSAGYAEATVHTPLLPAADASPPPDAVLQADNAGSFYLGVDSCVRSDAPSGSTCAAEEQSYWRYVPPTPSPTQTGNGSDAGGGAPQLPVEPLTQLLACPLGTASASSPLAFDGVNLVYPDPSLTNRAPYTDTLEALDTSTCLTRAPRAITVHFDPAETRYIYCGAPCAQIRIDDLTYDARRRVVWFVAGESQPGAGPFDGFLFTAPWPTPDQPAITDVWAHVAFYPAHHVNGCGDSNLAYDVSDDSLWTCSYDSYGRGIGDHIRASDGGNIPDHCGNLGIAGVSYVGVPGHLYQWSEDDVTITDTSPSTCSVVRSFVHPPVAEPPEEDEQLACDPLTFTSLRGWVGPGATVFWLRESGLNRVDAYASASAVCPLPTALSLTTAADVACGDTLTLSTRLRLLGPDLQLPQQTVDFSIDGVPAGSALTAADGSARLTLAAPLTAHQYSVTARYSGTGRLLPSTAGATMRLRPGMRCLLPPVSPPSPPVALAAPPTTLTPPVAPLPQPQPAPGEQPAAQPAANAGLQAEMQVQAQTQVQSVAQAQPGMMTQPQVRRRLATRTARDAPTMTEGPRSNLAGAEGLAAVATVLLLGWVPRSRRAVCTVTAGVLRRSAAVREWRR